MKKKILLPLFLLFLGIFSPVIVSAENISSFQTGYAYTQVSHNIGLTWVTYNSSNNVMYNYNLPNSDEIDIEQFHFRISLGTGNQFKQGFTYIISFDWMNDETNYGSTKMWFDRMVHTLFCRVNNWNATNESGSSCFVSSTYSSVEDSSNSNLIHVTFSFVPAKDFFGLTIQNNFDNSPYTSYPSDGWEISDYSYTVVSDGTQDIIDNQNQNTQDIIDNQNQNTSDLLDGLEGVLNGAAQNTEDIIDNQNQNTQALQDTINDNFQSCHNSYNLLDYSSIASNYYLGVTSTSDSLTLTAKHDASSNYVFLQKTINLKPNTDYTISVDSVVNGSDNIGASRLILENNSNLVVLRGKGQYTFNSGSNTYVNLYLYVSYNQPLVSGYTTTFNKLMFNEGSYIGFEPYGEQICKNKLDETTDSINNLNDTINNSDTSDAESDGASFFNSFTESDHGGLSAIITAPLVVVNSMLTNNSCPDLQFQVLGADVSFPSGCILWNNATSTIVTLWQTIVCGFISYCLLRKLFKDIENLKNPQDQEVSTLDL